MREGTAGDTFYILSSGEVTVSKRAGNKEEIIRSDFHFHSILKRPLCAGS